MTPRLLGFFESPILDALASFKSILDIQSFMLSLMVSRFCHLLSDCLNSAIEAKTETETEMETETETETETRVHPAHL